MPGAAPAQAPEAGSDLTHTQERRAPIKDDHAGHPLALVAGRARPPASERADDQGPQRGEVPLGQGVNLIDDLPSAVHPLGALAAQAEDALAWAGRAGDYLYAYVLPD
ncbi:hypothetical protein SAMN05421869_13763 [Nonomuraea jiangxiensis]|uniref:Uncharacterized protein n=1 Tax=Nonomuraea jiangxiensis TaxID=633440 RepID=A0A1G9QYW3_9ACTN|nr:hypothetical protein SAMN05421869_13763 [Nonomuraea jiangxiensis]